MNDIKYPLKVICRKEGDMRYFSQLDLVRLFERALRRAKLPVFFTKGFSPHAKMSFSNALKLGVEGEEEVTFYFTDSVEPAVLVSRLQPQLPRGLTLTLPVDTSPDTRK